MSTRRRLNIALSLALLVVAASCGDDALSDRDAKVAATTTSTSTTTTVAPPVGKPNRVMSLSPTATETLFAIGAGPQVIAVDSTSIYPAEAPVTDIDAADPDMETIASYQPDLIILDGTKPELQGQLNEAGYATLVSPRPRSLDGVFEQIETIGAGTGNIAEASSFVTQLQARALAVQQSVPDRESVLGYYYEIDPSYSSLTSETFMGTVLALLGLESIADPMDNSRSDGYPQLTSDFIVDADPDVILLADTTCCQQSAQTIAGRDGWEFIRAVDQGHVIELDGFVASGWGPRIVDLMEQVAGATADIQPQLEGG